MLQATFPPGVTSGKILVFQQACDDIAQAEQIAAGKLRAANLKAKTGIFTISLNLSVVAGCTVMLQGWGVFDGLYYVDKCVHSYGKSAGTSQLTIHKCLVGY
jgi:hypothetical protein